MLYFSEQTARFVVNGLCKKPAQYWLPGGLFQNKNVCQQSILPPIPTAVFGTNAESITERDGDSRRIDMLIT